jgi:hypothetical protein
MGFKVTESRSVMDVIVAKTVHSARTDTLRHLRRHCSRDAELGSSSWSQFDDGEMFAAGSEADVKIESSATVSANVLSARTAVHNNRPTFRSRVHREFGHPATCVADPRCTRR